MIEYRPFLNCDPPAIAELWRSQPPSRGRAQPMTAAMLDEMVLAKPYFEREGLILAFDGQALIGFGHAGFGPTADESSLDRTTGVICQLVLRPDADEQVSAGLVRECERYLCRRGAQRLVGGGTNRLAPFYLGLYGGGRLPAVLQSDRRQVESFRAAGYDSEGGTAILECRLAEFRPVANREIMALRRQYRVQIGNPERITTWWEACHRGQCNEMRFTMSAGGEESSAAFWDLEPLASSWGTHAMGLWDLRLGNSQARSLFATYLLGESMRAMQSLGISLVEIQIDESDQEMLETCQRLGFGQVDRGIQFFRRD